MERKTLVKIIEEPGISIGKKLTALKVLTIPIICLCSAVANATGQDFTNQQIKAIASGWGNEGIYLITANTANSIDGCGPNFMMPASSPMLNQVVAIALSAYTTAAPVILHVDGCFNSGSMNLKAIQILK